MEEIIKKSKKVALFLVILTVILGVIAIISQQIFNTIYWRGFLKSEKQAQTYLQQEKPTISSTSYSKCLGEWESVEYVSDYKNRFVDVYIKNGGEKSHLFKISDVSSGSQIEVHKCGLYLIRAFGFDYDKMKELNNYRVEIWKYSFDGDAIKVLTLGEKDQFNSSKYYYEYDFRINDEESYITLIGRYASPEVLTIKDLNTVSDAFVFTKNDLLDEYGVDYKNPELLYLVDTWKWNENYFTFTVFSNISFRVNISDWRLEKI